jgi:type II secretory pathway pseudopilin PulG
MTRRIASVVVVAFLALGAAPRLFAAPPGSAEQQVTLYELVLRDGSRLYGTIEREDPDEIVFKTQSGAVVTAKRSDIDTLNRVTGTLTRGEFLPPDPNATRLYVAPTRRALARGQTYLGVYEFVMPFVQVGVTDWFSLGGGTPLVFGIDDGDRPFWVTPKVQVLKTASTDLAVGVLHAFNAGGDGGGVAYAVSTTGTARGAFTVGAGVAYNNDGGRSGVVMLGGERQVRRNLKLISENYVWKDGKGVASAGVRFFGERLSADLALGFPIGAEELFAFPIVNFVYMF